MTTGFFQLFLAVNKVHGQADDNTENNRPDCPCNTDFKTENSCGQDYRQDIDGWPGVKKSSSRPKTGSHFVNARKQRQNRTGTNRKNRSRYRCNGVSQNLVGLRSEISHYRRLADKNRDSPGDKKGRHQAQQNMLPGIPLNQMQRFGNCIIKTNFPDRQIIASEKYRDDD